MMKFGIRTNKGAVIKLKKLISLILACALVPVIGVSANTQSVEYSEATATGTEALRTVNMSYERVENYTVTLPKMLTFDGTVEGTSTKDYTISVNGDIATDHYVRVIPLNGATMYEQDGIYKIPITVDQTKRRFTSDEVGASATATGSMTVEVKPGVWTGSVKFMISLDDGGLYEEATCTTPRRLLGYDTNDDGSLDANTEKLAEPEVQGRALGHQFNDGETAFPAICNRCGATVYGISCPEQLVAFRDTINGGNPLTGCVVELLNDIDMAGEPEWTAGIGSEKQGLYVNCGFEGNNYSIKNLTMTIDDTTGSMGNIGLFDSLRSVPCFRNFTLDSAVYNITTSVDGEYTLTGGFVFGWCASNNIPIVNVHAKNCTANLRPLERQIWWGCLGDSVYGGVNDTTIDLLNCSAVGNTIKVLEVGDDIQAPCVTVGYLLACLSSSSVDTTITAKSCYMYNFVENYTNKAVKEDRLLGAEIDKNPGTRKINAVNCYIGMTNSYGLVNTTTGGVGATTTDCYWSNNKADAYNENSGGLDTLNTDQPGVWVEDLILENNGYYICTDIYDE